MPVNSADGFKFLFHGGRQMLVIPVKLLKSREFKVVDAFHVLLVYQVPV